MNPIREDPGRQESEPACCPACGDQRPRYKGRRGRNDVYECTQTDCNLVFEILLLASASRPEGGRCA
jgi:hypothetical protein